MTLHPPEKFLQRLKGSKRLNIDKILAFAAGRSYTDWMCNIGVSGEAGVGKSTFTIHLGLRADKDFWFDSHVVYMRREVIEKAYKLPKHSFLIVDEAIGAHKRRAMEAEQKDLVEWINKIRFKNHVVVWNLPFFTDLDKDVRKHFDIWIHVVERGRAVVLVKNRNILAPDPWLPEWWYKKYKSKAMRSPEEVIQMLREHPLYEMTVRFPPLSERLQKIYSLHSEQAKQRLESEEKVKDKPYLRLLKTTNAKLLETYVASVVVLGKLLSKRNGGIGVQDLREAFDSVMLDTEIETVVGAQVKDSKWWPPDPQKFAKHILDKYEQYVR